MKQEHDDYLVKNFPLLYRDRGKSMQETSMCWGFCCEDGWFELIKDLSKKLEKMVETWRAENPDVEDHPCAAQVKEKWGSLRFYMNFGTQKMFDAVSRAEKESEKTCEWCGSKEEA